jgi:hypothetical protein
MTNDPDQDKFDKFCHDLRNHLTVIKMNAELMSISPTVLENPELTKFIDTMNRETDKMISMINEAGEKKDL